MQVAPSLQVKAVVFVCRSCRARPFVLIPCFGIGVRHEWLEDRVDRGHVESDDWVRSDFSWL